MSTRTENIKFFKELGLNCFPIKEKQKEADYRYNGANTKLNQPIKDNENYGIVTGKVSGCKTAVVIDIDAPELNKIIFDDWDMILKQTLVVQTGRGGYHVWVYPNEDEILQTKRLTNNKGQHMDIQATGVYVMGPGSIHNNGNEYKIISSTSTIKKINVGKFVQSLEKHGFDINGRGLGSIEEISKGVKPGAISDSCFKLSCHLLSIVGLDQDTAWKEIERWYASCPIDDNQRSISKIKATFKNAVRRVERDGTQRSKIKDMQPVSPEGWQELLNTYVCDNQLFDELNNKFIVNVDDEKIQECMRKYPASFFDMIKESVRECGVEDTKVELLMTPNITMGELKPTLGDKIICFDCEVRSIEERQTYTLKADYICEMCKEVITKRVNEDRYISVGKCDCKKRGKLNIIRGSIIADYVRGIWISESVDEAKHNTPQHYKCRMFGDIVGEAFVGQRKRIIGQFKSIPTNGEFNDIVIDTIDVMGLDDKQSQISSEEEINEFKERIENDGDKFLEKLADEYYTVIGNDEIKQSCILASCGAPATSRKINKLPILLLGDPGAAKSTVMEETLEFNFKSILTGGRGNTGAGLTGGMDRPAPNMPLVFLPGALTIANDGLAGIDEIDKCNDDTRESLLIAMAKGHVPINKVGVHGVLPTRTTIIATANPTGGRWKDGVPVLDQTKLSEPLLSRFVLIFLIKDEIDEYKDTTISTHIMSQMSNETEKQIDTDKLMRYITYVKKFNPLLTQEAMKAITDYYVKLRALSKDQDTIPIDPRKTEGLAVIAMANARLHMKEEADITDVNVAIKLFEAMLASFGIKVDDTGKVQNMFKTEKEQTKDDFVIECINTVSSNGEENFSELQLNDALCNGKFFDEDKARRKIFECIKIGRISLNQDGTYRK